MNCRTLGKKLAAGACLATLLLGLTAASSAIAAPPDTTPSSWHAETVGQAVVYMLIFAAVGIASAIAGFKLFDLCTPGNLGKEILEHRNVAAAIVAGAVILGVCIIIAAAMLG